MARFKPEHIDDIELETDRNFGKWLRSMRTDRSITEHRFVRDTNIERKRLIQLQMGNEYGATRDECIKISALFGVPMKEVLDRAAGEIL